MPIKPENRTLLDKPHWLSQETYDAIMAGNVDYARLQKYYKERDTYIDSLRPRLCSEPESRFCVMCGKCTCPRRGTNPDCPLHAPDSKHAKKKPPRQEVTD